MPGGLNIERTIHELFAEQARITPEKLAIAGGNRELTYLELETAANRYAHEVLSLSDPSTDRVALLMDDDARLVAVTLGVMKAGKATVVLNPSDPPARMRQILEDARPGLILADARHHEAALAAGASPSSVVMTGDLSQQLETGPAPDVPSGPDQIACLIYTSGSTGPAKGVIHTHRSLLFQIERLSEHIIRPEDRVALFVSLSGLGGVAPLWTALLNGATVSHFIIAERGLTDLAQWTLEQGITALQTYPTVFRHLVRVLDGELCPPIRLVSVGGEPVTSTDLEATRRLFGSDCMFANVLASTEAGLLAIHWFGSRWEGDSEELPVGRPVDGIELRLLDGDGHEVAPGEVGEIAVQADNLPLGYWHDEALTASRFRAIEGRRFFYTGDLASAGPDGLLKLHGRRDLQVKVRGNKISLRELERTITALPNVTSAAVCTTPSGRGDTSLTAFLATPPEIGLTATTVREALREVLPEREIPTAFVFLESLPATAQGKVDRARLTELALRSSGEADASSATRPADDLNETEELLAAIWARALELEHVGAEQDFFEVGGDSLAAAVIAAHVHSTFGVRLDLRAIVDHPTVAELALLIASHRSGEVDRGGDALERRIGDRPAPMTFTQERTWRLSQTPEQSAGYTGQTRYRITGQLNVELLREALELLLARHDAFRTSFRDADGAPVQILAPTVAFDLEVIDLTTSPDPEARSIELLSKLANPPFDLERAPLVRMQLLRIATGEHHLHWVDHHIITDAWSSRVFFSELRLLYEALGRGEAPLLDDLPFQPSDFANWERRQLDPSSSHFQGELAWWRRVLIDAPATPRLPFSRERDCPTAGPSEGVRRLVMPSETSRGLERLGHQAAATFYMVTLTVLAAQLAIETGTEDLVLGTYASGRSLPETHAMLGFFANMVTLRLPLDLSLGFRALLGRVRACVIDMTAHSDFPYELLREQLALEEVNLPEIGLIFNPVASAPMQLGDIELTAMNRVSGSMPWGFTFVTRRSGESSECVALFDARIYDPEQVGAFLVRYTQMAAAVSKEPDRPLAQLAPASLL